jgi:phosphate transport system substrate-binding protein
MNHEEELMKSAVSAGYGGGVLLSKYCPPPGGSMNARSAVGCLVAASLAVISTSCSGRDVIDLQGAGATFPAPLYKRWFLEYYRAHPDTQVSYQSIGSGAGIRQFAERNVDFGASDSAMNDKEIEQVKGGVLLLPVTAGSLVLAYNVTGVNTPLRLSRDAYVRIFLGEITSWDDEAIRATNPGVSLPSEEITVVRRADGSGTTYAFTNHLSAVSPAWKNGPGTGKSVVWPKGVGARGNAGVTALVQQTPGSIGYLEYGYAELGKLPMAVLENHSGRYLAPGPASGKAALAGAAIPDNLRVFIPDPKGADAYPIVTYTWILCYKHYADADKAAALKKVLRYCLTDGQQIAGELGYIPLPEDVTSKVLAAVDRIEP